MAVIASGCVFVAAPQNAFDSKVSAQQLNNFEPRKLTAPSSKRPKPRQPLRLQKNAKRVNLEVLANDTNVANSRRNLKGGKVFKCVFEYFFTVLNSSRECKSFETRGV